MFRHESRNLGHGAYGALNNWQHHKSKRRCELISHLQEAEVLPQPSAREGLLTVGFF